MVWHFWLAVPIAVAAVALVVGMVAMYAAKVTKTRFPNSDS